MIILVVVLVIILAAVNRSGTSSLIRKKGVKAVGTIIENREQQGGRSQLGGNINTPTIRFFTTDGQEIIGRPLTPFISQFEVPAPSEIHIIYDPDNPTQFIIDGE